MSDESKFSLQQEIKKRRTQELINAAAQKRSSGTHPLVKPPGEPTPTPVPVVNSPQTKKIPDAHRSVRPVEDASRITQEIAAPLRALPAGRRRFFIAVAALLLSGLVCSGTLLIAAPSGDQPTATPLPLPVTTANDVLDYFKKQGIPITDTIPLISPSSPWQSKQAVQFSVKTDKIQGKFVLLSYDSEDQKVPDIFLLSVHAKYKAWTQITAANIILLVSPETSPDLRITLESHLTQLLVQPYRSFLPTATPQQPTAL